MEDEVHTSIQPVVKKFLELLIENYLRPLWQYVKDNPDILKTMPGMLLGHEKLVVYVGRTHIGVEYVGPELIDMLPDEFHVKVKYHDYSIKECNLLEEIIGIRFDSTADIVVPLPPVNENIVFPSNRGLDKLENLGWNFAAQNAIIGVNMPAPSAPLNQHTRIINGFFFDADDSGLITRHIKWLDLIPISFNGDDEQVDSISFSLKPMHALVERDARFKYPLPDDYKFEKLPKINRFIELWGNDATTEPQITSHLAKQENKFILTMRFGAIEAYPQLKCEWQSEERDCIQPDFFLLNSNGYADIVEFKLPNIKQNIVVGRTNRESFSAMINSYIAQTRTY